MATRRRRDPRRVVALWVLVISLLGAALRLITLPWLAFRGDEVHTLHWTTFPVSYLMSHFDVGLSMHLYLVLLKGWRALAGGSELALKLPSLLAGILTIPLMYVCGARLASRKVAAVAALLACLNLQLIEFSRSARVYAIFIPLVLVVMVWFNRALRTRSGRDLVWLALANAVLLMLSLAAGPLLLAQGIALLWEVWARPRERSGLLGRFAASYAGALLLAFVFYSGVFWNAEVLWKSLGTRGSPMEVVKAVSSLHSPAPAVIGALILAGAWRALRYGGAKGRLLVAASVVPVAFHLAFPLPYPARAISRYLVVALPAHLLVAAVGVVWLIRAPRSARLPASLAVALLIALGGGIADPTAARRVVIERHPTAQAATALARIVRPSDLVWVNPVVYCPIFRPDSRRCPWSFLDLLDAPLPMPGGRLVIVSMHVGPQRAWKNTFDVETISGRPFRARISILVSRVPFEGPQRRAVLKAYASGLLAHSESFPRTSGRYIQSAPRLHRWLSVLEQMDGRTVEASRHLRAARAIRSGRRP